ncbi:hypothetical protein DPMN_118063 [Dreissena polymorpha]|uniref:Uncharacterized protein n=1 Tax=Dreissena polymorpha TaxID=45954 RepID=A0A9D4JLB7_DREPO|nr:hypothetical protein DPMN_118063 [Dreissena polymorpha]
MIAFLSAAGRLGLGDPVVVVAPFMEQVTSWWGVNSLPTSVPLKLASSCKSIHQPYLPLDNQYPFNQDRVINVAHRMKNVAPRVVTRFWTNMTEFQNWPRLNKNVASRFKAEDKENMNWYLAWMMNITNHLHNIYKVLTSILIQTFYRQMAITNNIYNTNKALSFIKWNILYKDMAMTNQHRKIHHLLGLINLHTIHKELAITHHQHITP